MKVVLYARVSTAHHGQDPEVQLVELRRFVHARGWQVIEEISDHGFSGGTDSRPGLKRLWELVRSRKCDVIVVVKLDRLFRSLKHLVNALDEFKAVGVELVSMKDSLDFTTPAGRLMFGVLACLAEFEKDLARERTIAGLQYAKSRGIRLGRRQEHDYTAIQRLRSDGLSYRAIQKRLGCGMGTIATAVKQGAQKPP